MILVIDTSSSTAAIAMIGDPPAELHISAWSQEVIPQLRQIARDHAIAKVAVATGPGSFTGLRVGVSFGLGLALGLHVPIVALPTLDLQAARAEEAVTAVVEAGRGRFYHRAPGADAAVGDPADIEPTHRLVGRLSSAGEAALIAAGLRLVPERELRTFSQAASILLETAPEVAYGSLEIEYMQSFRART